MSLQAVGCLDIFVSIVTSIVTYCTDFVVCTVVKYAISDVAHLNMDGCNRPLHHSCFRLFFKISLSSSWLLIL